MFSKNFQNNLIIENKEQSGKEEQPYFHELIKPFLIKTSEKADCWRDAIIKGGKILVENGYTTEEYLDAMIAKVEEFGPYCVIVKGLALAHAETSEHVNSTAMSLLLLPEGIKFDHETNDPVHMLFCFCVNDDRDYLKALTNLIALGKQKDFIPRILAADSNYEVHEIMKQYEINLKKARVVC